MAPDSKVQGPKASESAAALCPWDQQPGEPDRWYGRFQLFLSLGPTRTQGAAAKAAGLDKNGGWAQHARVWHWRERAAAWDAHQRNLLALTERNVRIGLHRRRVGVIEEYLETVRAVLDNADLPAADQALAREWLPQMRVFLRDLLVAERQEFEHDFSDSDPANQVAITADDLAAAQRALEERGAPAQFDAPTAAAVGERTKLCTFLVCTGSGSELLLDLAALRAVRAATGLRFQRMINATRRKLSETLRRQRNFGHPIEYIHMAVHASAAGLELADGPVDGNWLSERLDGVRVLLLASCASDSIGDWLGVVPYVITLSEDICNEDAAALAQHFWHAVGSGQEPDAALDTALARCPPAVGEYVVRHW